MSLESVHQPSALPTEFVQRLRQIIPQEKRESVLASFRAPKPTAFRVNRLKAHPSEVRAELEASGFGLEPVAWYEDAFILRQDSLRGLQETSCYQQGRIYVQGLSSMLAPLVLDPRPGEQVLDIAAAPGSKATQIAALMKGEGYVVANDNHRSRFYKLKSVVAQQSADNVECTLRYGESFARSHPGAFDRVLVDAPCSSEARFRTGEPRTYRYWSLRKIREMVRKQRRLLLAGLGALRPGGVLVYSTCSFAPEENEAIVSWTLAKCEGAIRMEDTRLPLENKLSGLTQWQGSQLDIALDKAVRILPNDEMEGFFLARLRKPA